MGLNSTNGWFLCIRIRCITCYTVHKFGTTGVYALMVGCSWNIEDSLDPHLLPGMSRDRFWRPNPRRAHGQQRIGHTGCMAHGCALKPGENGIKTCYLPAVNIFGKKRE